MKFSSRITTIAPSLTLQITAKAKALKAKGVDVISFGAGEPDFDTPEIIKKEAIAAIQKGVTKYTPASGTGELKKAIIDKFKKENGLEYTESQIVVSCGAKHSLYNVFQILLEPGDEVVIASPYWLSYPEMVKLAGGVPVILQTEQADSFKISPDQLKNVITEKTRALIINSPSNPTGTVYTKNELYRIAQVALEHSILIVSDEIYEHLIYDALSHVSIASLGEGIKKNTIVINGVSKSYAMTGWRIGYLAADEAIAKAVGTLQSHSTSNPTSFAQSGAVAALRSGTVELEKMVKVFAKRRDLILKELESVKNLCAYNPQGSFYVFCDITESGLTSIAFANRLLDEAQVAVIPGEPFGCPTHIRLSFAISDKAIKDGVGRIRAWIDKL